MPPDSLANWNGTPAEKKDLLDVARHSIFAGARGLEYAPPASCDPRLREPWGAFVTLRQRRRLRGCMGQLPSRSALIEVVAHCAKSAALEDPRFEALRPEETSQVAIEISVLSPLEKITLQQIEIGRHGLLVRRAHLRGVLLPQVATEFRWDATKFLEETCHKAGLDRQAWREADTEIQAFSVTVFREEEWAAKL
ncbi:MAG TPA: AmmeMemoRadiSam system protein A [Candidatus Acidoferrales bacterium]